MSARLNVAPGLIWGAAAVGLALVFGILGALASAVSPAPSGPALSSYATAPTGLAAWAELLERDGHRVAQVRGPIGRARLPGAGTLVVLGGEQDMSALSAADGRAIKRFLERGGRLVINGRAPVEPGRAAGRVIVVPDPRFLENRNLARDHNAYRALTLAGAPGRAVFFDETIHGYGPAAGLAALPTRWWFAFALLALALGAWALSRGMRLGGSDPVAGAPASPRTGYVQAMAETLVRTESREALLARVDAASTTESAFGEVSERVGVTGWR